MKLSVKVFMFLFGLLSFEILTFLGIHSLFGAFVGSIIGIFWIVFNISGVIQVIWDFLFEQ